MATSFAAQSLLPSPVTARVTRSKVNGQFFPLKYVPRLRRNVNVSVRCMADEELKEQLEKTVTTPPPQAQPSRAAPKPKMSTKFSEVLAFSGPAPERINGRLAMIGFVAAMGVELAKGQDVFTQISSGGLTWFLGTSVLLSVASLIPLFKGVSVESKSEGLMTSDTELWNGRFAMLGLVALALTEYVKGGTLL